MSSKPASKIIEQLGDDVFIAELGFTKRNLRHVRTTGRFAAGRYRDVKAICDAHGVQCPLSAFNWKEPDNKIGNGVGKFQGKVNKILPPDTPFEVTE